MEPGESVRIYRRGSHGCTGGLALVVAVFATALCAQEEEPILWGDRPIENAVVGRDLAFRLRAETQASDDQNDLIDEDPRYAQYPSRIYSTEAKAIHVSRLSLVGTYEYWENKQDLDVFRAGGTLSLPFLKTWRTDLRYLYYDQQNYPDIQYYYGGVGGYLGPVFTFTQYRYSAKERSTDGNQAYQYLSWTPDRSLRLGAYGAYYRRLDDYTSWYVKGFLHKLFLDDRTGLRLEAQRYKTNADYDFQEYRAYVYQRVWIRWLLRAGYRYYRDDEGVDSHAGSFKVKCYLLARLACHAEYIWFDQNEGANINMLLAGVNVVF